MHQPATFDSGAVVTTSGNSSFAPGLFYSHIPGDNPQNLNVLITTAAVGGTTPTLTVEVQWSHDNVTFASAATPDVFTAITANGSVVKGFSVKGKYARLKYTVTGTTPTFTVTATGVAV